MCMIKVVKQIFMIFKNVMGTPGTPARSYSPLGPTQGLLGSPTSLLEPIAYHGAQKITFFTSKCIFLMFPHILHFPAYFAFFRIFRIFPQLQQIPAISPHKSTKKPCIIDRIINDFCPHNQGFWSAKSRLFGRVFLEGLNKSSPCILTNEISLCSNKIC